MSISLHECLQSAIKLREEGEPAASLTLLDEALKRDEQSPLIDDNRARAYVDLNQHDKALHLWQQLADHDGRSAAAEARKMLGILTAESLTSCQRSDAKHIRTQTPSQMDGTRLWRSRHLSLVKLITRTESSRINTSEYLREATWNGEIITDLINDVCAKEQPRTALLIRTPTTGEWMTAVSWPENTSVTTLKYFDQKQSGLAHSSFLDRNKFILQMKRFARLKKKFDIIAIDPFHEYHSSQLDLELSIDCLGSDGLIFSHDCAPSSIEMAEPLFASGCWCGTTYAALAVLLHDHPQLAVTVLDTDTGVGILRRRSSQRRRNWLRPVELNSAMQEEFRSLCEAGEFKRAYKYFRSHGRELVDLRRHCTEFDNY